MVNAVYDHVIAILAVGVMFVSAVEILPTMNIANIQSVDQQQLRNTALNVFNAMLLETGDPINWGSMNPFYKNDPRVKRFGLASAQDTTFYMLDPDKVQRLVTGNPLNYCDYNTVRQLLKLQNYGFRLRIIPPFNVTFLKVTVASNTLNYSARVFYLDGTPIPNAEVYATVIYTQGDNYFNMMTSRQFETNAMGIVQGNLALDLPNPNQGPTYYIVTIRVTVANVATLIIMSSQVHNNTIANINLVYDTLILTTTKAPPDYNQPPNDNVWILNVVTYDSSGQLWNLYQGDSHGNTNKFNTGDGSFEYWNKTFVGLHGFQPVMMIFNFWAVDQQTGHGRQQVLIVMAYPNLLGTSVFEYGGSPKSGSASVKIQRSVVICGMTYTAELWLWKESP